MSFLPVLASVVLSGIVAALAAMIVVRRASSRQATALSSEEIDALIREQTAPFLDGAARQSTQIEQILAKLVDDLTQAEQGWSHRIEAWQGATAAEMRGFGKAVQNLGSKVAEQVDRTAKTQGLVSQVSHLGQAIEASETRIVAIEATMDEKSDKTAMSDLTTRMLALNDSFNALQGNLAEVAARIKTERIEALSERLSSIEALQHTLKVAIDQAASESDSGDWDVLHDHLSALASRLVAVETSMPRIDEMNDRLTQLIDENRLRRYAEEGRDMASVRPAAHAAEATASAPLEATIALPEAMISVMMLPQDLENAEEEHGHRDAG